MQVALLHPSKPGKLKQSFLMHVEGKQEISSLWFYFCFVPFWKFVEGKTSPSMPAP